MPTSTPSSCDTRSRLDADTTLTIQSVIGPDCSSPRVLTPGRHTLGRAPTAALRFDDPAVELQHAVLDVGGNGSATLTQLSGRRPIVVGTRAMTGPTPLSAGDTLQIGATQLAIEHTGQRRPPVPPRSPATASHPVQLPTRVAVRPWPRATVLTMAGTALPAGAVMWLLGWRLPASITIWGGVLALGAWLAVALDTARRRRSDHRASRAATDRFHQHIETARNRAHEAHRRRHRSLGEVLDRVDTAQHRFAVRSARPSGLWVTLGIGNQPWAPTIEPARRGGDHHQLEDSPLTHFVDVIGSLDGVAIPWEIRPGSTTHLVGPRHLCLALTRAVIVQIAIERHDPDWDLTVVTSRRGDWEWAGGLAHVRVGNGPYSVHGAGDSLLDLEAIDTDGTTIRVVVDDSDPAAPTGRNPTLAGPVATITRPTGSPPAASTNATLDIGATGRARWSGEFGGEAFLLTGLGAERAGEVARQLALRGGHQHRVPGQPVGGSPSSHRGPAPKPAAASSVL